MFYVNLTFRHVFIERLHEYKNPPEETYLPWRVWLSWLGHVLYTRRWRQKHREEVSAAV